MTKLSVIMPNYNHAHFLEEALGAILNQSLDSIELLFIDDASTDNSVELVKKYQEKYPQIKLFAQKSNQGPVAAMNVGLREATGTYIALCAADDKVLPGFFEESVAMLERYPQAGLCTTNFCYFLEGEDRLYYKKSKIEESCFLDPQSLFKAIRKYNFWIPGNATILRRELMLEAGLFKEEIKSLCDWFLCLVVAIRHGACYIPKPLTSFRMVPNSYSLKSNQSKFYESLFHLFDTSEYQDVQDFFLKSGIFFQLDKEIFPYLLKKRGCRRYIPRIFMQKLRQKLNRNHLRQLQV